MAMDSPVRFAFCFPMASGHINPSLPIARALVKLGHEVHYLCREQMRSAIEDTGASFSNEVAECHELFDGRQEDLFGAMSALKAEHQLEDDHHMVAWMKLAPLSMELQMPGVVRWMKRLQPQVVVFCPLMNREAFYTAQMLGIPSVGLLTTAGPGSMVGMMDQFLAGLSMEEAAAPAKSWPVAQNAAKRLEELYGMNYYEDLELSIRAPGALITVAQRTLTIVTTCEDMQDPTPQYLETEYQEAGATFAFVGPLLDQAGACRAVGHKFATAGADHPVHEHNAPQADPLKALVEARAAGRKVIFASMGTVVTGDSPDFGWAVKAMDTQRKGVTGKQLCQAAWGGVFDAFGAKDGEDVEKAPLVLMAVGPQPDALDDMKVPANALCLPAMPQVDLLRAGVDVFLTHGGQNSFMESLAAGVPVLVCPGFGDQPLNAQKAADLEVGLQVRRPVPEDGEEMEACAMYRQEVADSLRRVHEEPCFGAAAQLCKNKLQEAGGVQRAVDLLLQTAATRAGAQELPTLLSAAPPAHAIGKVQAQ